MESLQTAASSALATLLARQPLSQAKVDFVWQAVAGPFAHRATLGVQLEGNVLRVEVRDNGWARELSQAVATLVPRLNELLGRATVGRLVIRTPEPPPRERSRGKAAR
jgi:hypothetical protein